MTAHHRASRLRTPLLLALTSAALLSACGEATEGPALEAADASGISYGREDAAGIAPNTPEGDAILAFANRPLGDALAAESFLKSLQSELHELPAKEIRDYRLGADGAAGTADDATFPDLMAIDALPYTGPEVFEGLLKLAKAQGLYADAGIECVGITERIYLHGTGYPAITSNEQLRKVQESGCNAFSGDLVIKLETDGGFPEARTLEPLAGLRRIGGTLRITGSHGVTGLSGLRGLRQVGAVMIYENDNLASLDGLQGLTNLDALWLDQNPALISLQGLEGLQSLGMLLIEETPRLTNLRGLDSLTRIEENLEIEKNRGLTSLQGLGRLAEVGGDFTLAGNEALVDMTGLDSLTRIGGELVSSRGLYEVTGFDGLVRLKSVGTMTLGSDNPSTLAGLEALETIEGPLSLVDTEITNVAPLSNLRHVGSLYLDGNEDLELANAFPGLETAGSITIDDSQDTITGFGALTTITEELSIHGETMWEFDAFHRLESAGSIFLYFPERITRLSGFTSLVGVESTLSINAPGISDLSDLNNLELAGAIVLYTNASELQGLSSLSSIQGTLSTTAAPNLQHLDNLTSLTRIGGGLIVDVNFPQAALDRLLSRLQGFTGSVERN